MKYKFIKTYQSSALKIKIFVNRKSLISLIEKYLLFCNKSYSSTDLIEVSLYVVSRKEFIRKPEAGDVAITDKCSINFKKKEILIIDPRLGQNNHRFDINEVLIRPLACILNQLGYYAVHGSLVQYKSTCIICAGPGGSGKSTLSCVLSQRGLKLLCDDTMFISKAKGTHQVIPLKTHIKIDNPEKKDFIHLKKIVLSEVFQPKGIKKILFIFPRYHLNQKPQLNLILRKEGVTRLVSDNLILDTGHPNKREGQNRLLDFICDLGDGPSFFELNYNDQNLQKAAELINEIYV